MAKFYGSSTKMGKVGGSVFAIRNGVTIERQYQPNVLNPSTVKQVAARATMKLLSQLGEVFAPAIAFKPVGLVTRRNRFVSENYDQVTYNTSDGKATMAMLSVKLTPNVIGLTPITVTRATGHVSIALAEAQDGIDMVVYVVIRKSTDGTLRMEKIVTVDEAGETGTYPSGSLVLASSSTGYAYAYGVRFNNEDAKAKYEDIVGENPNVVINVIRMMNESDVSYTETVSAEITATN